MSLFFVHFVSTKTAKWQRKYNNAENEMNQDKLTQIKNKLTAILKDVNLHNS